MYFPQPRGKCILIDSHPSSLLTPPEAFKSFKGSKKKKKKRKRERRTTAGNKTTVWTVYSTAEIMEIPRNDGHEGLLKRIAGERLCTLHSTRFALIVSALTPHRRGGCCQRSCSSAYRRATLSLQPLFSLVLRPRPQHYYFLTSCYFKTIVSERYTIYVQQKWRGRKGDWECTILNLKLIKLKIKRYI